MMAPIEEAEGQIAEQSKKIDFYITEYTIELLASKMKNGEFTIPAFQREDIWEPARKSRFIESLMMGLPIPFLLFWENPESGKLEIVDGSQRLRTIEQFVLGELVLGELETLSALSGYRFRDLMPPRQRKFTNKSIRGIVLNEHADEQARSDLFDRINTGSKLARDAEVRRGSLGGPFVKMVIELAEDPLFEKLAPVPDKERKLREREELVTRFFAYGDGSAGYNDRVGEFLFAYAKKMNNAFAADPRLEERYRRRFASTMQFVQAAFPQGFRKTPTATTTPRARFEAIALGCYFALKARPSLAPDAEAVAAWSTGSEFLEVTGSDSANAIKKLRGRINFVTAKLLGVKNRDGLTPEL